MQREEREGDGADGARVSRLWQRIATEDPEQHEKRNRAKQAANGTANVLAKHSLKLVEPVQRPRTLGIGGTGRRLVLERRLGFDRLWLWSRFAGT